jgi:Methyltransferase domain
MIHDNITLTEYSRRGKKCVEGWFQRIDAEIFSTLLAYQNTRGIAGGCCEIGVHHGKSFIPLCLSLNAHELALCIDIFEDQTRNLDQSGCGDRETLFANLKRFGIHLSRIRIIDESSENVSFDRIIREVGPVRFFSIDGGHWKSIVQNDLALAGGSLVQGGVIALDDVFRTDWPEVSFALASWLERGKAKIVPFACGTNKLYLCHEDFAIAYRESLRTEFLTTFYVKTYRSKDFELDSYRFEIKRGDEADFKEISRIIMRVFFPDVFFTLKRYTKAAKDLFMYSRFRQNRTE